MTMGGNEGRLGNTIHLLGRLGDIFHGLKIFSSTYPVAQSHVLLQFCSCCCYCTRYALYYQHARNSSGLYVQVIVYWAQPVFSNLACRNNLVGQCMNRAVCGWIGLGLSIRSRILQVPQALHRSLHRISNKTYFLFIQNLIIN